MSEEQRSIAKKLIIQVVVGYMYKVMKSGNDITLFKKEFAAIRHGDYQEFLNIIGKPISSILIGNLTEPRELSTNVYIEDNDIDFIRLLKSAKSLRVFHENCINEYGIFKDPDIPHKVFEKLPLFELSLRIHRNNRSQRVNRITLESVIDEIKHLVGLTEQETEIFHEGRRFLNTVKRPVKLKTTWKDGIRIFETAYRLLEEKKLTII